MASCFSICCGGKEETAKYGAYSAPQDWGSDYYGQEAVNPSASSHLPPEKKRFDQLYKLGKTLGEGNFAIVKEGFSLKQRRSKREKQRTSKAQTSYAIKIINRGKLSRANEQSLQDEIKIQSELDHDNIVCLYEVYKELGSYFLVLEKVSGGELFDRVVQKTHYNEKEARDLCKIILGAMKYCHSQKVAHRDLKPENLLLSTPTNDTAIKIADFGFAKIVSEPNSLTTQCGTPSYVAPEILNGVMYDERADNWSLGVIAFIILGGYPPFADTNHRALFRHIRSGKYVFDEQYWGGVSKDAKDFIRSLLDVDCTKRATAQSALEHNWIGGIDDSRLEAQNLGVCLKQLKKFNAKRKFKSGVQAVIATNKLNSLGHNFHKHL